MDCILNLITRAEDERIFINITIAVFFYIRRAFDTVSHMHVLHELFQLGLRGCVLRWIREFFTSKRIMVMSTKHALNYGVSKEAC